MLHMQYVNARYIKILCYGWGKSIIGLDTFVLRVKKKQKEDNY